MATLFMPLKLPFMPCAKINKDGRQNMVAAALNNHSFGIDLKPRGNSNANVLSRQILYNLLLFCPSLSSSNCLIPARRSPVASLPALTFYSYIFHFFFLASLLFFAPLQRPFFLFSSFFCVFYYPIPPRSTVTYSCTFFYP